MKTILVPTDFSETAEHGLKYALLFARRFSSKIILLNAWDLPQAHSSMLISIGDIIKNNAKKEINNLIKTLRKDKQNIQVTFEAQVKMGDIVPLTKNIATKEKADIIITATSGASGLKEIFLGSNAGGIMEDAPCPVLIIPNKAPLSSPKKIAYATNLEDDDGAYIQKIQKLFSGLNASINVFHIGDEQYKKWNKYEEFTTKLNKTHPEINVDYLTDAEPLRGIDNYITQHDIDMLVLSTQKHTILNLLLNKSLSKKMAYHSNIPILIFQFGKHNAATNIMHDEQIMYA